MSETANNLGIGRTVFEFSEAVGVGGKRVQIDFEPSDCDRAFLLLIQNPPTPAGGNATNLHFYLDMPFDGDQAKTRLTAGKGVILAPCKEVSLVLAVKKCCQRQTLVDLLGLFGGAPAAVTPHLFVLEVLKTG